MPFLCTLIQFSSFYWIHEIWLRVTQAAKIWLYVHSRTKKINFKDTITHIEVLMLSFETFCSSIALKKYFCLHFKNEIYEKQQCLKKKSLCTFSTYWARGNSPLLNLFLPLILRKTMNENMSLHHNIFEQVKDYTITTGVLPNLRKNSWWPLDFHWSFDADCIFYFLLSNKVW